MTASPEWPPQEVASPGAPRNPEPGPPACTSRDRRPVSAAPGLRRLLPVAVAVAAVTELVVCHRGDPSAAGNRFLPCPFKLLTGWDCPGCGSQRMLHELTHLRLAAALHDNAAAVAATPFLLYTFLAWTLATYTTRRLPRWRPGPRAVGLLAAAVLTWGVARNLPIAPLSRLHV